MASRAEPREPSGAHGGPARRGAADAAPAAKKVGRPPKVTPELIAQAALEIGLDHATVRNVAERLGMSVPGLYYYVRTREELLAMAAAYGLGDLPLPPDTGQPWTEWLLAYARFVYDALVAQPEIVGQILAGTYNTIRMTQHLEGFFAVLVARGFTVDEAYRANRRLTEAVIGAAAAAIGQRATVKAGHPLEKDLKLAVKALGADTVPLVEELLHAHDFTQADPFATVRLVVDALAAARPEPRDP